LEGSGAEAGEGRVERRVEEGEVGKALPGMETVTSEKCSAWEDGDRRVDERATVALFQLRQL
jgi:hypothetical protein